MEMKASSSMSSPPGAHQAGAGFAKQHLQNKRVIELKGDTADKMAPVWIKPSIPGMVRVRSTEKTTRNKNWRDLEECKNLDTVMSKLQAEGKTDEEMAKAHLEFLEVRQL